MFKRSLSFLSPWRRASFALPLLILLLVCPLVAADFFPLAQGNSWTYRTVSGDSFTVRVGGQAFVAGRIYHFLNGYVNQQVMVRLNEAGDLVYFDEERDIELPLTMFTPTPFGRWQAPFRPCEQLGQAQQQRTGYQGPAGKWSGVLDVQYLSFSCADAGVTAELYAENIGMLSRTVTTIAGPRTYNLVAARIGKQIIEAGDVGRFTVSVAPAPQGLSIQLRADVNPEPGITLHFPTAQEFEVVVRNPNGAVVWSASEGQFFVQIPHDRVINGQWTATVVAPWPPITPQQGAYTVEAWLTTTEDSPRFAASTTFQNGN